MKRDGKPERAGETRYQADAVAQSFDGPDGLHWRVSQGDARTETPCLAMTRHWRRSPGSLAKPMLPARAIPQTLFYYPDVSNNNWSNTGQALYFLSQLKPEGFAGVVHKCSEGSYFADPYWQAVRHWCETNDLPWLGYHYVTTNDPAAQAAEWNANNGGPFAMLDFEANSGDVGNFWDVVEAFNVSGVIVTLGYLPQWYVDEIGGDLSALATNEVALVSSAYPAGAGYASSIYAAAGGRSGEGWNPYCGGAPTAWQFTDQADVAGFTVDCNAFYGANLNDLFTGAIFQEGLNK